MMKILLHAFLSGLIFFPGAALAAPEVPRPGGGGDGDAAVEDRLTSSLFLRAELADKIIEAGQEGRFVDMAGIRTNAGAKSALLAWIQKNPTQAAQVYSSLTGEGGPRQEVPGTGGEAWEINPVFQEAIKALSDAAGDASVSNEMLALAARRLYEGPSADGGGLEVRAGGASAEGAGSGGRGLFPVTYADYRLNKSGLEREIAKAGEWLKAARGGRERPETEGAYSAAFAHYSEFIVAAAALKSRAAVTERESAGLETRRVRLRTTLAVLTLRLRGSALADVAASLEKLGAEPGAKELLLSVSRLKSGLEARAARVEAGGVALAELGRLVNSAENEFAALSLGYSAYYGLVSLKNRTARAGFSCFYDYAVYRYLSAFFPGATYPGARAELAAASGELDAALLKAGTGDIPGALSGLDTRRVEAVTGVVRAASSFNRRAQFFLWGLLFRPVECIISVSGGRAGFRPAFTFFEITGKTWPSDGHRP